MYKIYIIEDDSLISSIIADNLEKWGFKSRVSYDFGNILAEFHEIQPHLVLLDINLPQYDGYYWCDQIRLASNVPIIFISSRTDDKDKIRAMMGGGDDYIEKPFSIDVLIAKVQAMLRRTYSFIDIAYSTVTHSGLTLDIEKSLITYNDQQILLTRNECIIMSLLLRSGGKVVSRSKIIKTLWEDENFVDENTLSVNVARLRQKLNDIGAKGIIATIKGKGYIIK